MKTLKDRCAEALAEMKKIERNMEQGVLNGAHIKRWDAMVAYLVDFVHAETGRGGSPKLEGASPVVMYLDEKDREEVIAAFHEVYPNAVTRKLP
jgi:hypothetical protein